MKRWMMVMVVVVSLLLATLSWTGNASAAEEKIVPTQLADKSALYNAKRRWGNEVRIYDMKTYVDLSGQPAAYVYTIYKKSGEAPTGSALSNRIAEARGKLKESQAKLDELNQELRNKGKRFTAPPPSPEGDASELPTGSVTFPVSAVLPPELLATDPQPSVRISAKEKKANAFREAKQKADQLRREVFQMDLFGTVVVGAHFGAMPFLEMFDGLALHHTMLDKADAMAADTLGAENVERGDFVYLGPTFFVYEYVKDGRRVLTDPTTGQSADKEVMRSGLSGKSVTPKADPAEAWQFIKDRVDAGGDLMEGDVPPGGAAGAVRGVPFYHQDVYGPASCGPTSSAQLLGYWDDHGYGNLIDNGRSNTGHEWQLISDLMEAEVYDPVCDPDCGTSGGEIRPGILAVANDHKYGNNNNFTGAEIAAYAGGTVHWSDITGEINAGRPFVYFNWEGSSYPYWAHFTTAVGYEDSGGRLHVHWNYPPDTDYIINWQSVPSANEAMYMIYPGTPYQTVFSEDVEGAFPDWWTVKAASGYTDAYWGDHFYRPHGGYNPGPWPPGTNGNPGWSAYCADGGSARVDPPGPYPNNMAAWMIYGPFSMKDNQLSAKMEFYYWNKSQAGYDSLAWMASSDGTHFDGQGTWVDSGGWQKGTLDLSGYNGDDSVWVAFAFSSNSSVSDEGAYVDDITIRKADGVRDEQTKIYLGDYDGNLRSDLGLFRPSGSWYVKNTKGTDLVNGYAYGQAGDIPVMGDYDGDGEMDIALFRPSTGVWYAKNRSGVSLPGFPYCFGKSGDIPVPGDYDGDGRTDIALWRPSVGIWYAKSYATGSWQNIPGFPYCYGKSGDIPVPAPYAYTGKTDIGLWRPSTGNWYMKYYSNGAWHILGAVPLPKTYGVAGDRPVPGDYDGNGTADIGIFRPSTGKWYAMDAYDATIIFSGVQWGASGDIPVPLDYDGDGATELAVWRPSTADWYIEKPDGTYMFPPFGWYRFGLPTDKPLGYNSGVAFMFF